MDRQLPLGATQAQIDRAYKAYYACWTAQGVPTTKVPGGGDGGPLLAYKMDPDKYQKAVDACADSEPFDPPELDPQQNSDYWDELRSELQCMQAKGYPLVIHQDQEGLWVDPVTDANNARMQTDQALADYRTCELQSFSKD